MRGRTVGLLLALASLTACASAPPISTDLRRRASAVVLVEGPPPPGFRVLGQVEGFVCQKNLYVGGPSFTAAREELKIAAARRGATGVVSILCQEEGTSFSDNCWKSIRCVGDAGAMPSPTSPSPPQRQAEPATTI